MPGAVRGTYLSSTLDRAEGGLGLTEERHPCLRGTSTEGMSLCVGTILQGKARDERFSSSLPGTQESGKEMVRAGEVA